MSAVCFSVLARNIRRVGMILHERMRIRQKQ